MLSNDTKKALDSLSTRPARRERTRSKVYELFEEINTYLEFINSHFRIETYKSSNHPSDYMKLILKEKNGDFWQVCYEFDTFIDLLDSIELIQSRIISKLSSIV